MKYWSVYDIFTEPWARTTEAVWKKYPNDEQPHVKSIDVLDRKVTADGRLLTTRLFGAQFSFPSLIVSLLGLPDMSYAIEYSEVDLKTQTMTLRQVNSTFGSVLLMDETVRYRPDAQNSNLTQLKQSARIGISGIPFNGYFEGLIVDGLHKNSAVGRSVVLKTVKTLGVEYLIDGVTAELRELSQEIDNTASRIEDTLSEKMAELAKDLDQASGMINDEIRKITRSCHSEMLQILNGLESELTQVSVKINLSEHGCTFESAKTGLLEAVIRAGITVKPSLP